MCHITPTHPSWTSFFLDMHPVSLPSFIISSVSAFMLIFTATTSASKHCCTFHFLVRFAGQFWNIPVQISPPLNPTMHESRALHTVTVSPPSGAQRRFLARLHSATWDKRSLPCYYAGSSQGGQLGEMESPHLQDPVIEGRYTEYIVTGLFETHFMYSRFDTDQCRS